MFQTLCDNGQIKSLNSFDCLMQAVPVPCPYPYAGEPNKKQEKKMYEFDSYEMSENERQKNYLSNALSNAFWTKDADLLKEFNLNGVTPPQSPKEVVEFIKADKFKFNKSWLNDDGTWRDDENHPYFNYSNIYTYMSWVDPTKLPDQKGYKAAYDKMTEAKVKADRKIVVSTPADGLAALEEFEAGTYH